MLNENFWQDKIKSKKIVKEKKLFEDLINSFKFHKNYKIQMNCMN